MEAKVEKIKIKSAACKAAWFDLTADSSFQAASLTTDNNYLPRKQWQILLFIYIVDNDLTREIQQSAHHHVTITAADLDVALQQLMRPNG